MLGKIFRGILDVLAALLLVVALLISVVIHGVFDSTACTNAVCTPEFDNALKNEVIECVESLGAVVDISGEDVLKAIGEENLLTYAHQYTFDFFESINSGEFNPKEFDEGNLKTHITDYIKSFDGEISDEEIQEIYELTLKNTEKAVKYIPGLIQQLTPKVSRLFVIGAFLSDIEILVYALAFVLMGLNIIFSEKTKRLDVIFGVLSALFCVLATFAIPLFMAVQYDVPSRIAVDGSLLIYLIEGLNTVLFVNGATTVGIAFFVSAVLLIIVSVILAKRNVSKKDEKTVDKNEQR